MEQGEIAFLSRLRRANSSDAEFKIFLEEMDTRKKAGDPDYARDALTTTRVLAGYAAAERPGKKLELDVIECMTKIPVGTEQIQICLDAGISVVDIGKTKRH